MIFLFSSWSPVFAQQSVDKTFNLSKGWEWKADDSDTVAQDGASWKPFVLKKNMLGDTGTVWLRVMLPKGDWIDPCIELKTTATKFEVYNNEKLVYHFITELSLEPYGGIKVHRFALGQLEDQPLLRVRVYLSKNAAPFVIRKAVVGSHLAMLVNDIQKQLDNFAISFLLMIVGIYSLALFVKSPRHKMFIAFALITISSSIYFIISSTILQLYFLKNTSWTYIVELFSLYSIPIGVLLFIDINFQSPRILMVRWMWRMHVLFIIGTYMAAELRWIDLRSTLPFFFVLLIIDILLILIVVTRSAISGNKRTKVLAAGILFLLLCVFYDILVFNNLLPRGFNLSPWAVLVFVFLTGYVMELRFESWFIQKEKEKSKRLEAEFRANEAEMQAKVATAQSRMIQSEKMASLGRLTAGIAHEIKNPLNFVNNFAELSLERLQDLKNAIRNLAGNGDGHIHESIQIITELEVNQSKINEHGKRADTIIKGMLLHARGGRGQKTPSDINQLLDEYLKLSYHGYRAKDPAFNMTLTKQFDAGIPEVELIPQDMGRVFTNIITNGFYSASEKKREREQKYLEEKIETQKFVPEITVTTKNLERTIEIRIRDNGKGIPDTLKDKMFVPFFTTKPAGQGTGLGLSISYDIVVNGHSGSITVDSKEGEYAEFVITLPKS